MYFSDAVKVLGLELPLTENTVRKAYAAAAFRFHPDKNPAGEEMMKVINEAKGVIDANGHEWGNLKWQNAQADSPQDFSDAINAALAEIVRCAGLKIEVDGTWIWVGGDTLTHRTHLKSSGFSWSKNKMMWYWRPAGLKRNWRGKKRFSIDEIRARHGHRPVATQLQDALA